jgi:GTP cyclohydrolase I
MTVLTSVETLTLDQAISTLPTQINPPVSEEEMQAAVGTLLLGMGEDPDREGLRDTPKRVVKVRAKIEANLAPFTLIECWQAEDA